MRSRLVVLALVSIFSAVACGGDDGVGIEGDSLSQAEAEALAQIVMSQGFSTTPDPTGAPQVASRSVSFDPIGISDEITVENLPCPNGGTYSADGSYSGTVDPDAETLDITYTFVHSHSQCAVPSEEAGVIFTLDGNPNITHRYDIVVDGGSSVELTGGIEGGLDWSTDDERSGTCPINIDTAVSGFALDGETGSISVDVSGLVCGVEFSRSISVSPAT